MGDYGEGAPPSGTTSFQLTPRTIIDAGTVFKFFDGSPADIENVILSHSHLDHLLELPFLIDATFSERKRSLRLFGERSTLRAVRENLFNGSIWPDFTSIELPVGRPALELVEIREGRAFRLDGLTFKPFRANHSVPTLGFIVEGDGGAFAVSGDTFVNPELRKVLNLNPHVEYLFVDVSFPSSQRERARESLHLTPELLVEELSSLRRRLRGIFVYHGKPFYLEELRQELSYLLPRAKLLIGGESLDF